MMKGLPVNTIKLVAQAKGIPGDFAVLVLSKLAETEETDQIPTFTPEQMREVKAVFEAHGQEAGLAQYLGEIFYLFDRIKPFIDRDDIANAAKVCIRYTPTLSLGLAQQPEQVKAAIIEFVQLASMSTQGALKDFLTRVCDAVSHYGNQNFDDLVDYNDNMQQWLDEGHTPAEFVADYWDNED